MQRLSSIMLKEFEKDSLKGCLFVSVENYVARDKRLLASYFA